MLESIIAIPVIILFVLSVVTTYVAIGLVTFIILKTIFKRLVKRLRLNEDV